MKSLAALLVAMVPAIAAAADWQGYARLSREQMAANMNAIYASTTPRQPPNCASSPAAKRRSPDVLDISRERRNGYAWYGDAPAGALTRFAKWIKR